MMTHLHVKSTEPKAAPQPVSTVPTRGNGLVAFPLCPPPQRTAGIPPRADVDAKALPPLDSLGLSWGDQREARQRPGATQT